MPDNIWWLWWWLPYCWAGYSWTWATIAQRSGKLLCFPFASVSQTAIHGEQNTVHCHDSLQLPLVEVNEWRDIQTVQFYGTLVILNDPSFHNGKKLNSPCFDDVLDQWSLMDDWPSVNKTTFAWWAWVLLTPASSNNYATTVKWPAPHHPYIGSVLQMQSSDGDRMGCLSAAPGFSVRNMRIIQYLTLFMLGIFELTALLRITPATEKYWKMTAIKMTKRFSILSRVVPACSTSWDKCASIKFNQGRPCPLAAGSSFPFPVLPIRTPHL